MPKEIDCEFTDEITCPYCGKAMECSYELMADNTDCGETECESCGESFAWSAQVSITYSTAKK
jgi:transcription elongation factor Elf1